MLIGTPREIKNHEYRVGLTPESAAELVAHGHDVLVETMAGGGIGATDEDYQAAGANIDRTILISPSAEFAASLPNGKIPDRTDFKTFSPQDRMRLWCRVVEECERLGDELNEVIEKGELESRLTPL